MSRVTLATLPNATEQEVFDQVARHLLTQKQRSMGKLYETMTGEPVMGCAYRGNDSMMCAAGCLIGDDEYKGSFEDERWGVLAARGDVPDVHRDLIARLQSVHDTTSPELWVFDLDRVATTYALDRTVLLDA